MFEGTPSQMHASLAKLADLPSNTEIYCAHEYTLANLEFACHVDPENQSLNAHLAHCKQMRQNDEPTIPSSLAIELAINPFLRCDQPALRQYAGQTLAQEPASLDVVEVFAAIRKAKDHF